MHVVMQGLRFGRLIIGVPLHLSATFSAPAHDVTAHADHNDIEQTILDALRNVRCRKAKPVSDHQPGKVTISSGR